MQQITPYLARIALLFCLFSAAEIQAQTPLSGKVVDKTNMPIPSVYVNFNNGLIRTISDLDGNFSLTYPDTVTSRVISFQAIAYKLKTMQVNKGQERMTVILLDSLHNLHGVMVTAPKQGRFSDYSAQAVQMSALDIVTNPAAMADLIGNMRVLPGVQANDNDGRLIIQGGSPGESQVYVDDLIIYNPYNISSKNTGVRSRFTPDLFEGITLQSGGYNAEFGQALSGIVNLNTLKRDRIENKSDFGITSVGLSASTQGKKGTSAYRAGVSYTNLMPYGKLVPDDYKWGKYYEQLSADLYFTHDFSSRTQLTTQFMFSRSGLNYTYNNIDSMPYNTDMTETYLYAQANLYHTFSPSLSLSAASNLIFDDLHITAISLPNDKLHDRTVWNHNKVTLQYSNGKLTNRSGAEFALNPFRETYTLTEAYQLKADNNWGSLYNDTKWLATNNLSFTLGLRAEYATYLKRFNWTPRLYIGYRLNKVNILSASIGEYKQLPAMDYLKYSANLDFTSATKATLSYNYVNKGSKLQVDTYYKKYRDVVTYQGQPYQPTSLANDGKGYGWGTDVFWKSHVGSLEYWLTYSFNDTRKQYDYHPTEVVPDYLSKHNFNTTLKYWFTSLNSLLSCNYHMAAGTPYYLPQSPYDKMGETPFRNRLDLSLSYLPKPWIIIHLSCQNVLGSENIYGYEYSRINPGVSKAITNPDTRFYFIGVFITFSHDKTLNQLKSL